VRIPRRRLSGAVLTLTAALAAGALAGCSGGSGDAAAGAADSTGDPGWEFTDDLGATVTLDEVPTRVAGLNDVLSSLWNYGVEPVASFGQTSIADDVAFEGKDLSDVEVVGTAYGQIDLEALAAADPDVIVTSVYPTDSAGTLDPTEPLYGFESVEQQELVAQIAPIIAIAWRGSAAEVIDRTLDLAGALGVDLASEEMAELRAEYDRASAQLTEAAASGLTVLPVAAYPDEGFYMAKAQDDPSLRLYSDLGVQFVDPGGTDYFWEVAGWETVTDHPSDLILYSLRGAMTPDQMAGQPTYRLLPAVQAGQVHPWEYRGMDHPAQTAYMEQLAGWLTEGEKVT
jgi:iron complex transport system substrate-binding protein